MVRRLKNVGFEVVGIDKKTGKDCRAYFRDFIDRFDLVVHCAAVVGGRAHIDGNPLAVAENLAIDSDMFRWALKTRQPRVVYFSSSAAYPVVYQGPEGTLLAEEDIGHDFYGTPDNTYGWSKLVGEQLATTALQQGVKVHVFRPFSGYGSDQDDCYPFPAYIHRAKRREDPFIIWGDGTSRRDWIHVDDVVEAVLAAVDQDFLGPVNLCTGLGTSFDELASLVCDAEGYTPAIEYNENAPQGVHTRVGDPEKMLSFYMPMVTLSEGIRRSM
jgi:Nucleoside-diphosphate-sugar epimerases